MQAKGISWVGTRTDKFDKTVEFFEKILNAKKVIEEPGFAALDLPNGDTIEVFVNDYETHKHFTTGPVVGFDIDDIKSAVSEFEKMGIEIIGGIQGDPKRSQWVHFKGPDGNIYELKWRAKTR